MKVGIIVAMGKEMQLLLPLIENKKESEVSGFRFYEGLIGNHEVVAMQCGIGKVNAAVGTVELIEKFSPQIVINTGVAGGADKSMHVLDLLVATGIAYHDVWCGPGTEYGAASGCPAVMTTDSHVESVARKTLKEKNVRYGLICSGDKFISTEAEVVEIKSHFPDTLAVDMESAAIAQVCNMKKIPVSVIRVISDTPRQEENISQYENFWNDAPAETFRALLEILNEI